ncbi:dsDNA nuclease domain-containing protein [Kocuria sp. ICS0012]|uniref:dsDNA nuclease domain-containing protein n=1 Tax=Kocuria sp. ICS0012 TaxID=1834155 RepID=UPI0007FDAEE8|nr:dsDNA nuclease domain-containing protein [Kocuria sp. ICS0012]OBA46582.1 hypothetical protein A5728_10240 [Kocuria sp. ICS0012]
MAGHNAAASAAGYLYQTNWALVELLRKGRTRPDQAITLELHDDVAWTTENDSEDALELLQVKLHTTAKAAGLGDMGVDIWKTLKVWMDRPDATDPHGPDLALVTTSIANPGTAAFALRPSCTADGETRDVTLAIELLVKAASESTSAGTQAARMAFLALGEAGRSHLINRVRVLDGQISPEAIDASLREELAYGLPAGQEGEDRFVAQVWHWWAQMAIGMLSNTRATVSVGEVRTFIRELRNSYTTQNLPTTVPLSAITNEHIGLYDGSLFVAQLKLVDYAGEALRTAIIGLFTVEGVGVGA